MAIGVKAFKWKTLSPKQRFIFLWWRSSKYKEYDAIVCDGAVRSGKTVSMALSFVDWATETFDGVNVGMAGKTIQSLRRNVVTPLKQMMIGRKYSFKDNQSKNYIEVYNPRSGNSIDLYLFGGKDESSQDLVQGITTAGFFFDEVALMPESFVNQAVARCSIDGAKFWFNCNPDHPKHWFNEKWLKDLKQKNAIHLHFTMEDNWSLTEATRERYRRMFTGVFYQRYILGLWVAAEGVIYDMFRESEHAVKKPPFSKQQADRLFISIDYGTQNATTFGKYGARRIRQRHGPIVDKATQIQNRYHLFETYYHSGRDERVQKTDREYVDDLEKFIGNDDIKYIIVDPSAASFIAEIESRRGKDGRQKYKVIPARNEVLEGIKHMMNLLKLNLFTLDESCKEDITEFFTYAWDKKALERGEEKPIKEYDHCMDRNRYACYTDTIISSEQRLFSGKGGRRF